MSYERRQSTTQGRRILVIANEAVAGAALHQAIRFRAHDVAAEVLVVVPALGSRLGDRSAAAMERSRTGWGAALTRLRAAGVRARGQLGDRDPLRAIRDALAAFAADEILVATDPLGALALARRRRPGAGAIAVRRPGPCTWSSTTRTGPSTAPAGRAGSRPVCPRRPTP